MSDVVVFNRNTLGEGPCDLGELLILNFLKTIDNSEWRPQTIVFYNSGVLVFKEDGHKSPFVEILKKLQTAGIDILICETCVKYFQIEKEVFVGRISNMREIVDKMKSASRVITP